MKLLTTEQVFLGLIRTHIGIGTRVIGNNFNIYIDWNYLAYLLFLSRYDYDSPSYYRRG